MRERGKRITQTKYKRLNVYMPKPWTMRMLGSRKRKEKERKNRGKKMTLHYESTSERSNKRSMP
jgi:hypothetical protein